MGKLVTPLYMRKARLQMYLHETRRKSAAKTGYGMSSMAIPLHTLASAQHRT
jgi:hypothetical protein